MAELQLVRGEGALQRALAAIREDVDDFFDRTLTIPNDLRARLVSAMRYAVIGGGKRLRPLLTVSTAALYNVDRAQAVRAGCAVEAIHVYSLIHDDLPCMDDDALRRGQPTVHLEYDEATAVLAGDSLHALAFELLSEPAMSTDPFLRAELVECLARASGHGGMAGGQMMDMASDFPDTPPFDLHTITRLQQLKTGALLGAAVEMGAILGRIPPDGRSHLRAYARDIGLAFQIADDLLDVEGDEETVGKAVGKDSAQGKQTFVTLMGVDGARAQANALVEQAIGHLSNHGDEAEVLRAIARYIVERDR
ncbi:polyprenyl synthetase family protein [Erythrobacter sp. LQ02-29]|uniref:polyprenyl synthetase family protein n=1 Tax=Erythrobacter sp. LQ02-29 TaxID=2920384 RepID=UPI001F4E0B43|nr:farnesyl diphosphate synthase [Erythrobacter sp. LQ02-29]MCP9223099.1 polyprenyl synthetase family protein [Erythrobacter sp. LQ02-29]